MLPLLTVVLLIESCLALLLVSRIKPLVKTACLIVDISKTTKGSAVSKTLAATLFVLLASSIATFVKARQHMLEHHGSEVHGSPAEFFMMRTAELESALSGFILLLALMINRVHFFLREASGLKLSLEVVKKQSKTAQSEYLRLQQEQRVEGQTLSELKGLKDIVEDMREKVEKMQVDVQIKEKEVRAAEASVLAIRRQTEGIRLEYERLVDDNENLRNQLAALDRSRSRSEVKKNT
ncbi:hypothetical protein Mapa_007111 [Marchantia paleacea]|nr:hypothetical protein Mapa_007111 [Marchantia paleacea]